MKLYIGLDIGGTKFMVASGDAAGRILNKTTASTPVDLEKGLSLLHKMIAEVRGERQISGIGAAIGGPLDRQGGVVSPLHQPHWRDVPLKSIMEERYRCPFNVDVDTNVAALGEYFHLKSPPARLLYITLSTGMGGGFVINGKIYRGMAGAHPEIGHQSVNFKCSYPERISCECGAVDCLEGLISGNGIRRIYQIPAEKLNEQEWQEVAYNLGQGLRNLATIYLPDTIILGGSVAIGGGRALLSKAVAVMRRSLKLVPVPKVKLSTMGVDTPLIGAIRLAIEGGFVVCLL
jgi:glucokinase